MTVITDDVKAVPRVFFSAIKKLFNVESKTGRKREQEEKEDVRTISFHEQNVQQNARFIHATQEQEACELYFHSFPMWEYALGLDAGVHRPEGREV